MSKEKFPVTPATRLLLKNNAAFTRHLYPYEEHGGTAHSARCLGVDEHGVIKTLIKELARLRGVKTVAPCAPAVADRHSGYRVGGTSPFGARKPMPVSLEASILELPRPYINGGKRGFLVGLAPAEVQRLPQPTLVQVAIKE